jgi:hypothetical protein
MRLGGKVARWQVVLCLIASSPLAVSTAQQPSSIFPLPLELADLSIAADTISGVAVIMQPSVTTKQKKDGYVWLRFLPDSALEWINSAVAAIRTPVIGAQSEGIQWSRTLVPVNGRGAMALGRSRKKGNLQKTHWLAIADSATGWRFEMTGGQADSLLRLLLSAAAQSRIDTTNSAPLDESRTDVPVHIVHQPRLVPRERAGRVLAQWVVGVDGLMEPASFVAVLASDPALTSEALETVRGSRFRPAERGGKPVRQLMVRQFIW